MKNEIQPTSNSNIVRGEWAIIERSQYSAEGIVPPPVQINLKNGIIRGIFVSLPHQFDKMCDIVGFQHHHFGDDFHDLSGYDHPYVSEQDMLDNTITIRVNGEDYRFYKVHLSRHGSSSQKFTFIAQGKIEEMKRFQVNLLEGKHAG